MESGKVERKDSVVIDEKKEYTRDYVALAKEDIPDGALHTCDYFDKHIYPHLGPVLALVAKERPENPVAFIAEYLLKLSRAAACIDGPAEEQLATSN